MACTTLMPVSRNFRQAAQPGSTDRKNKSFYVFSLTVLDLNLFTEENFTKFQGGQNAKFYRVRIRYFQGGDSGGN